MITETLRETGTGEDQRPRPTGDFDGVTRADAMRLMLNTARLERRARLVKRLRRPFIERFGMIMSSLITAGIIWTGPKLTPEEAAAILRPNQTIIARCSDCTGPRVVVAGTPGATTWLTFPPPTPARRLDGTRLSDPPQVYGTLYSLRKHSRQ